MAQYADNLLKHPNTRRFDDRADRRAEIAVDHIRHHDDGSITIAAVIWVHEGDKSWSTLHTIRLY